MLQAQLRRKRKITQTERRENALFLQSDAGLIRIWPQTEEIVRVSYTENGRFAEGQGAEYADLSASTDAALGGGWWDYAEREDEILIKTAALRIVVSRETGSIRYEKTDGTPLAREREWESKTVEEFDAFRTVVNQNTQLEEIQTPDGVKRRIRAADRVFDRKLYHTRLYLSFAEGERLYGLGQAEDGDWDLRHTTQYLHQANRKIALPLLLSGAGYGILLSTRSTAIFHDTNAGSWLYTEADEYLDYYFLAGRPDAVIRGFRALTGKAVMLPKWAFGYIQSRERYETAQELVDTAAQFRRRGIGLDCLVLDWQSWRGNLWGQKTFDEDRFPDPADMLRRLHEMDVHFMISIWPNMSEDCENYREFAEAGLLLPASEMYDALSEEGRKLYWKQAERGLFVHGTDAWWCDSCEPVTPEWEKQMKPEPGEMYHEFVEAAGSILPMDQVNAYAMYHARAVWEGQRASMEKASMESLSMEKGSAAKAGGPEKRVVNLTRSGWAGSQRYGTILWSGDTGASWETLKKQIPAGLQFVAAGLPYWTLDIGGFFIKGGTPWFWDGRYDETNQDPAYRELYVRWFQYGAFLPVFRSHGTDCPREPWQFGSEGDPFYDAITSAIRLRYRLLPYLYSLAGGIWLEDQTMMRPLYFDFPEDERACGISDEFLLGPALLICPVTDPIPAQNGRQTGEAAAEGTVLRRVYLPVGTDWYDLYTKKRYEGGREVETVCDISRIPVYVRAGSILPLAAEPGESAAQMDGADLVLQVYPGADGSFTLYEDAGDGYGYEKGEYCLTRITWQEDAGRLSWETEGDGRFRKGKLEGRIMGGMQ